MAKSKKIKGSIRSSQLVTTYGVGAMVAIGDESYVIAGIDRWPDRDEDVLQEPRLEAQLRVFGFRSPPARGDDAFDIPVRRFPEQHSCPSCNRLDSLNYFQNPFGKSVCGFCDHEPSLVPSRFVVACQAGHLDEFPYFQWAHSERMHEGDNAKLKLRTRGESSGLRDVIVECSCGASRTMEGAFRKKALRGVRRCQGRRPWLHKEASEDCELTPEVIQRGASNVWFSDTVSAISIPPWSDGAFRILDRHWKFLKKAKDEDTMREWVEDMADERHTVDDLVSAAMFRIRRDAGDPEAAADDVKSAEYEALMRGAPEKDRHDEFVCLPADDPGPQAGQYFTTIRKVTRLREVRVLRGFSRLYPPSGTDTDEREDTKGTTVLLDADQVGWLPAIEVSGEGVFLELGGDRLDEWERREDVIKRVERLESNAEGSFFDVVVSPRKVMIHTLAHALIDQWALECGYPAASLSERLYVNEKTAGILVYTATTDSAGSLGGGVSMTDDGRLSTSLIEAMRRSSWCSSDPLCIETATQGPDSLNLAACHACALLPETSCEERNLLLDRALLIGTPGKPELGFFSDLLD